MSHAYDQASVVFTGLYRQSNSLSSVKATDLDRQQNNLYPPEQIGMLFEGGWSTVLAEAYCLATTRMVLVH